MVSMFPAFCLCFSMSFLAYLPVFAVFPIHPLVHLLNGSPRFFLPPVSVLCSFQGEAGLYSYPADVWALGLTMIYVATGVVPLPDVSFWEMRGWA